MKKVLLGLVIAVMMTSSGYVRALEISDDKCDHLEEGVISYIDNDIKYDGKHNYNLPKRIMNLEISSQYLSLWSELCKD